MAFDPKHNSRTITDGPTRAAARSYYYSHRLHDGGPREADHRHRQHLDRHDAVQLQPAPARREGRGGRAQGRRHADGVQHHRHQRRHHDGHRGHEDVARLARADRRLASSCARAATCSTRSCASSAATRRSPRRRWRWRGSTSPASSSTAARSCPAATRATTSTSRTSSRASARTPPARCPTRSSTRSSTPPARARAPAAGSSPPTRWRSRWSSSASRPWACNGVPAVDPRKDDVGVRAGELVMDVLRRNVRPLDILTRAAFENAIAGVAATGGSTNAVLHLLALAREAERAADHRRLRHRQRRARRCIADLQARAAATSPPISTGRRHGARREAAGRAAATCDGVAADAERPHVRRGGGARRRDAGAGRRAHRSTTR